MSVKKTKFISLHEAAKLTDYSQEYISLLCRRGKMEGKKLGRNWFTKKEWIEDYVNKIKESKLNTTILQPFDKLKINSAQNDNVKQDDNNIMVSLSNHQDNDVKENVIPVKIKQENIDRFDETKSEDKISSDSLFSTKKLMLATIIFSVIVSGFVFTQYGIKQNLTLGVSDSVSESIQKRIISSSNSLDVIKNKSTKFASSVIAKRNDEAIPNSDTQDYNTTSSETNHGILQQAQDDIQQEIISLSNSLNLIKNESTKYANKKIADISNYASRLHSPARPAGGPVETMEPTTGRVAGVSTEDPNAPSQKLTFVESVKVIVNGIRNYLSDLFGKKETMIVEKIIEVEKDDEENIYVPPILPDDESNSAIARSTLQDIQNKVNKLEQEIKDKEVITITQTSKGEKGDIGPAGVTGPTGEQGLIGLTGPQGPIGTGNVVTVPSAPVNTNTWSGSNVFSGYGSFESLGVAYDLSAGRSFGSGGDTTLGSDSQDTLTVNATSTFIGPVNLSNASTLTTGTGQVTFGGNVGVTGNLTVAGSQTYSGAASFTANSTSPALLVNQQGTGNIVSFQDNGTDAFIIDTSGNVGIGTATPGVILDINDTGAVRLPSGTDAQRPSAGTGMIRYNTTSSQFEGYGGSNWTGLGGVIDVDQDTYILAESAPGADEDVLFFNTDGSERMRLDASGNLGIGTNSPYDKLHISGFIRTDDVGWTLNNDFGTNFDIVFSLAVYNDKLYAGLGYDADIYVYDGSTWSLSNDFGVGGSVNSLAVYNGKLYAGMGYGSSDAAVHVYDGSTWSLSNDFGEDTVSLAVYNGKLYAGLGDDDGEGDVYVYNGSTWSLNNDFGATVNSISPLTVYNGKLYAGVNSGPSEGEGDIYVYDGTTWSLSNDFGTGFLVIDSMAVYNGKLYAGVGNGSSDGDVYVYDGSTWSLNNDFGTLFEDIYSLTVYNGKLYAGLGKSGGDGDIYVYNGSTWSLSGGFGAMDMVLTLAVYNGKLYAGFGNDDSEGDIYVYSERLESQLTKEFNPEATTPFGEQYQHFTKDMTVLGNLGIGTSTPLSTLDVRGTIENGLVAWWSMDEGTGTTITDQSINSNTGTFGTSPADPTWANGKFVKALSFDGSDDYINIVRNSTIEPTSQITVEAWVKGSTQSAYRYPISKRATSGSSSYALHTANGTGLQFYIYTGTEEPSDQIPPASIWDNRWHHIVGYYDGNNVGIYLDGEEYGTANSATGDITYSSSYDLLIGKFGLTGTSFNGDIDEVRIYNRALSAREIAESYRQKAPSMAQGGTVSDNSAYTALTVQQSSTGDILNILDSTTSVFKISDGGNITASELNNIIYVDGTKYTQDSPGIQEALDDLPSTGGKVILPEGTYNVDRAMDVCIADDGGSFTDQTTECNNATANNVTLLPAIPAVNDAYYFGYDYQTRKASVNIGTQGAGVWTITWEYWNGAWTALAGVTDETTGFTATTGEKDVTYTLPTDWAKTTVNSTEKYYIRARVSAYTSITTQPLGTQAYGTGSIIIDKSYVSLEGVGDSSKIYLTNNADTHTIVAGNGATAYSNITISDLQIDGNRANNGDVSHNIYFYGANGNLITNSKVKNCYVHDADNYGIRLLYAEKSIITNNIIKNSLNTSAGGIFIESSDNSSIINNVVQSNDNGIYLYSSERSIISNNEIISNDIGIYLNWWAHNNTISNNSIYLNNEEGIRIMRASYNTITSNILRNNGQTTTGTYSDILLESTAAVTYNIISDNNILADETNKTKYGIYEEDSTNNDYNTITNNTIIGPVTAAILAQGPHTTVAGNKTSDATEGLFDISSNTGATQSALTVTQNGTGNIVNFKDGATTVFAIADGGGVTITGDLKVTGGILYDAIVSSTAAKGQYTSIQTAIDDSKKRIFVRNGTYLTTADIVVPDGAVIIGESKEGVIIDFASYDTDTATFTNASAIVAVTDSTGWAADDYIKNDTTGKYYKILTVDSGVQVTLTENYLEATAAGAAATIKMSEVYQIIAEGDTDKYDTGTITVTNGQRNVTGTSTVWTTNTAVGEYILLGQEWYRIASVISNTLLTIDEFYQGDFLSSGTAYKIAAFKQKIRIENIQVINSSDAYGAIYFNFVKNSLVRNVIADNNTHGIYSDYTYSTNFSENEANNNSSYGIYIDSRSDSNTLYANKCNNNNMGIQLMYSSNNILLGNECSNNDSYGIYLFHQNNNNNISDNQCNNNNGGGIYIRDNSNGNSIANNNCNNSNDYGIRILGSSNNTFNGNGCSDGDSGFYINGDSDNNVIESNVCQNNTAYGIEIAAATVNNTSILDSQLSGNTTAGISDAGTDTQISGNYTGTAGEGLFHTEVNSTSSALTVTQTGTGDIVNITNSKSAFTGNALELDIAQDQLETAYHSTAGVGSTLTDNLTEANSDAGTAYTLLAVENPSSDVFFFGNSVVFDTLNFDIATAIVPTGLDFVYKYSSGKDASDVCNAWTELTETDGTTSLTADGKVIWTDPGSAWIQCELVDGQGLQYYTSMQAPAATNITTASIAYYSTISMFTGNFLSLKNVGIEKFSIDKDGNLTINSTAGNMIDVQRSGTSVFTVGQATVNIASPLDLQVEGDVGIEYNLSFLNNGTSYINSAGPLTISAGDSNSFENLTITTSGTGDVIIDIADSTNGLKVVGTTTSVFSIDASGNVIIGGVNATDSDLTVKRNISTQGGNLTIAKLDITSAGTPSTSVTTSGGSCLSATTYYYRVVAVNGNGETDIDDATTKSQATGDASDDEIITVLWDAVPGATGYKVYRDTDDDWTDGADSLVDSATISSPTIGVVDNCSGDLAAQTPSTINTTGGDITGILSFSDATELTIATGVITATQTYHKIDTESDGATDDLTTINGGTEGDILVLRAENVARTVVVKDGTGNIQSAGDMSLDNSQDTIVLVYDGSNWLEVSRADSGADIAESYYTDDLSIEAGDVAKITKLDETFLNEEEKLRTHKYPAIAKTLEYYDPGIIGVISTASNITLGGGSDKLSSGAETRSIVLSGRVPVKVSLENGNIEVGDFLTSSDLPGIAVKATGSGIVIGRALEAFDGNVTECSVTFVKKSEEEIDSLNPGEDDTIKLTECKTVPSEVGKVMTFINVGWHGGGSGQQEWLEIKDSATGEIYCMGIENGEWNRIKKTAPTCQESVNVQNSSTQNIELTDEYDDFTGAPEESDYPPDAPVWEQLIENCLSDGGYWYDNVCNDEAEVIVPVCDADNLDLCSTEDLCDGIDLHWYGGVCNLEEE